VLYAGPLNPPAGPVASTYKTLTEVEPRIAINATNTPGDDDSVYKITQPGSYYLTGNITGVVGKHGIEIVASGVTLDLNGFDLVGIAGMGNFDGVSVTVGSLTNIAVLNGSVRSWGRDGVNLGVFGAANCRIEGVGVTGNVRAGMFAGIRTRISNCSASGGEYGLIAFEGSTISNCSANNATVYGIFADPGSTLSNCSAYSNTGNGIIASTGCTLSNCSAFSNAGIGIDANVGCTVSGCSAFGNISHGINAGNGTTVEGCTARANTLDGIRCASACVILGNTCSSNGVGDGAGIHATGNDNRIEGNNCTDADRGIDVDLAGNIIIKNTCSGNTTNWDVVAGNIILVVNGVAAGAVIGNTGGVAPGSTDPNANFSY
jgi:parallel beta-helix repeat protein